MSDSYIHTHPWSIIEKGFDPQRVKSSESLFSIGNGAMGQRANFEEQYSGPSLQGSYIGGVYYPDKTKVGWWKNGYPEYFAKVLNAPNWIGIDVILNGEILDLFRCEKVDDFYRELNMKEGYLLRRFTATLKNGLKVKIQSTRFLCMDINEVGAIKYEIIPLNEPCKIKVIPYIDADIRNEDANWEEKFWKTSQSRSENDFDALLSATLKTNFNVVTAMTHCLFHKDSEIKQYETQNVKGERINAHYQVKAEAGDSVILFKYAGYFTSMNHHVDQLFSVAEERLRESRKTGFDVLLEKQKEAWKEIWEMSDIEIHGDDKAQQGIRFNIFQLNQTYSGKDARLNIGPKGFTGEKYGGSTYWDTEAYCIPFYMATKGQQVARNLLEYRYHHLPKAIENAQKLGFSDGAALYPMVTMNGEECHNEWEITFEEIHRNGAIAYAIYNYTRYTGDHSYVFGKGLEVLVAIARFWKQRASYSKVKKQYVILGVTGPNEYENNVNNNFYTNYIARWCIEYAVEQLQLLKEDDPDSFSRLCQSINLDESEISEMKRIMGNIYLPYSEEHQLYLQQDDFLEKEIIPANALDSGQRPINQHWSWDRILRSCFIKQADVLQGMYFFEEDFTIDELTRHYDFYEPITVHESSLSPCVYSIIASTIDRIDEAYALYLRTSRLDLDDYNKEVEEGLHITSMAGTWLSIVSGFAGMRMKNDMLVFNTRLPGQWKGYSFKMNHRNNILKISVDSQKTEVTLVRGDQLKVEVNGKVILVE